MQKASTTEDFLRKAKKSHICRYYPPSHRRSMFTKADHIISLENLAAPTDKWLCLVHDAYKKQTSVWRGYVDRRGYMIVVHVRSGPYKQLKYTPRAKPLDATMTKTLHTVQSAFKEWILLHPNESSAILARYVGDATAADLIRLSEYFHKQNVNVPRGSYAHAATEPTCERQNE